MDTEAMQDSWIEWIGAIPPGWTVERLKKVSTIKSSNVDKKDYPDQIPVRLCNYVDVYYNDVIDSSIKFMKSTASELEYKKFHLSSGDVVLTKDSETPNDIAVPAYVAENIDDLVCGYHLAVMRANHKLDGKFLFRAIQSTGIKEQFYRLATGITRFGLKIRELESVLIPLPPLHEQQAIAQYLDQRCGKLDAIIAIKQQQIKTLDALRQSIIYHAVTKGLDDSLPLVDSGVEWLGKIPQGWRVSKLKYITNQIVDGTHFTPNYVESGVPFLRVTDIQTQFINFERIKFITEEEHTGLTKRAKPQKGDVLLSKNGTIGITKVVDWDWEFSIFVSLCLIKFLPNINPYYFSYFFESDVVNQQLFESSKKTSVTNLHLVKIRELLLCVPPFPEQQRIIDRLDQETQRLNDLKANLSQQISTLEAYKKALIYECVTGKKRINADVLKAG